MSTLNDGVNMAMGVRASAPVEAAETEPDEPKAPEHNPPPKGGAGSGVKAWRAHLIEDHDVDPDELEDLSRDDMIAFDDDLTT